MVEEVDYNKKILESVSIVIVIMVVVNLELVRNE